LNDFADKAISFFDIGADARLTLFNNPTYDAVNDRVIVGQVTFDDINWNNPIRVGVEARDDYEREDTQIAVVEFERNDSTSDADYIFPNLRSGLQLLDVEVVDNETSGAVVLESGLGTQLIPDDPAGTGENDDYQIRLTREPDGEVRVAVLTDGLADVVSVDGNAVTPDSYAIVGGLRATQMFSGNIIFGDDGSNLTLERGEGSDLGNFIDEGFYGESLGAVEVYDDLVSFGDDGNNLTLTRLGAGDFTTDFSAGEFVQVRAPSAGGFDANNDDYEILSVDATTITLVATTATPWATSGATINPASLRDFQPLEGQMIRIGGGFVADELFDEQLTFGDDGLNLTLTRALGDFIDDGFLNGQTIRVDATDAFSDNSGDYEILSVSVSEIVLTALVGTDPWATGGTTTETVALSELVSYDGDYQIDTISNDGKTITLTSTGSWALAGESADPAVLSDLTETTIFDGNVTFGEELDPQSFPGQFLDRGASGEEEGWLSEDFLEGMWVRIVDLDGANPDIEAKVQLIRGDNDSKDGKLQLINVQINDTSFDLDATWVGDGNSHHVEIVRIAATATFDSTDYYIQQNVELEADVEYEIPPTRDGVKIFPVSTHLLSKLRGPLAVEGGPAGADRSLTAGVKLPGEKDDFLIAIGAQPPESQQIDVLNIFNDSSQADTVGIMDQTTLRGFGMAPDLNFGVISGPTFGETGSFLGFLDFGFDGTNRTLSQSDVDFNDVFGIGDHIGVDGTDAGGFSANDATYEIIAISADGMTLTLSDESNWTTSGISTEVVRVNAELIVPGGISFGKVNFGSGGFGTDGAQSTIEVFNLMERWIRRHSSRRKTCSTSIISAKIRISRPTRRYAGLASTGKPRASCPDRE
jgi:hypothetical protein